MNEVQEFLDKFKLVNICLSHCKFNMIVDNTMAGGLYMSKLLVVDDEFRIRQIIRKYAEFEGHTVEEAVDGMQAIEVCHNNQYDLIIMDVMMPELDGFSACREIRKFSQTPVIMLSARGEEYDKIHGFELGIDDYVVSAHVVGDLVKWYAVDGGFFRYYYPSDDGNTKFGDEAINGKANHYAFDADALRQKVEKVAQTIGITAYGGDAIVRADGTFCIIDFNDWPSFSRCREDAAKAIAEAAKRII